MDGLAVMVAAHLGVSAPKAPPKFKEGDKVKICRLLDEMTSRDLLGKVGVVDEVEDNCMTVQCGDCNGAGCPDCDHGEVLYRLQVNYNIGTEDGTHYMHEEELEPAE